MVCTEEMLGDKLYTLFRGAALLACIFLPLAPIGYVDNFVDSKLIFKNFTIHEIAIGFATLWSASISYVSYQCYAIRRETFLRYMTLAFFGETIVYSLHGLLTFTANDIPILFILYGPFSRLIMAAFLSVAVLRFGTEMCDIGSYRGWPYWILSFVLVLPLIALLAVSPYGPLPVVRIGIESLSIAMYLFAMALILYRRTDTPLMWLYFISLGLFGMSSFAFILVKTPWNHMFWLAHVIFAAGFFVLSFGLVSARKRSASFGEIFNEEVLYAKLSEQVEKLKAEISARTKTEAALRASRAEAERANQAKSEFLSSMSHELRTPMNAILGFSQVMELNPDQPLTKDQQHCVDHIRNGGLHLMELIDQVLDLAVIESGNIKLSYEDINVSKLCQDCIALIEGQAAKKGLRLSSDLTSDYLIQADPTRFRQVLLNLLSNAIKYNRPDGRIELKLSDGPDDTVRICVADTGIGIDDNKRENIFEPFNRLGKEMSNIQGTGVGLSITKHLVEAMGGEIGFESTAGKGSAFWVVFPTSVDRTVGPDDAAPSVQKSASQSRRESEETTILYIEDDSASRDLMVAIVGSLKGISLLTATSAEQGLLLATDHKPDLILLDINLSGMDGYAAMGQLSEDPDTVSIPVIAVTSGATQQDVARGESAGFADYITKPLDVSKLTAAISLQLAR